MSDQALNAGDVKLTEGRVINGSTRGSLVAVIRGPGAVQTVVLMARVTFMEAVRRKILWIAAIAAQRFSLSSGRVCTPCCNRCHAT